MKVLPWNKDLSVGVGVIDADHKLLFNIIKQLNRALEEGQSVDKVRGYLTALTEYTDFHFAREEALMKACGYSELEEHREIHNEICSRLEQICRDFDAAPDDALNERILIFLNSWLVEHIMHRDKQYVPDMAGKDAEIATAHAPFQRFWGSGYPEHTRRPGGLTGRERRVVAMFVDLRGSTRLAEEHDAYDVVLVLNELFVELTDAIERSRGHYAQFNGDGLLALFGLEQEFGIACRQALESARDMFRRVEELNKRFAEELGDALSIGIGIHGGEAIVGMMGPPASPIVSAVGVVVNTASGLESETKKAGCMLVYSQTVADAAGIYVGDSGVYRGTKHPAHNELPVRLVRSVSELSY